MIMVVLWTCGFTICISDHLAYTTPDTETLIVDKQFLLYALNNCTYVTITLWNFGIKLPLFMTQLHTNSIKVTYFKDTRSKVTLNVI